MKRLSFILVILALFSHVASAQQPDNYPPDDTTLTITSTNLPIVWIYVDGATIDREERISARMKIIHNGDGQLNYADTVAHPGQRIDYEGYIALRYRGNSSFANSDKKPYSFRTLKMPLEQSDEKKKVDILGMGKDNNWALMAPFADKSMIRDLLTFELARPWMEYVPKGRFCEVYLDDIYYGVYVMSEVVSKGKNRLNLDDPGEEGDELTGGYIMEVDCDEGVTHKSKHHPVAVNGYVLTDRDIFFQYKSPDYEDMTEAQVEYINNSIDKMEDVFASSNYRDPEVGYRKYIDVDNFVDYQLFMELCHNVDAYRLSGKFFKRRDSVDSRFKMVLWYTNLGYGVAKYLGGYRNDTWMYQNNNTMYMAHETYLIPFWWYKLNRDEYYWTKRNARWCEMRESNLSKKNIWATIDSLVNVLKSNGALDRNTQAWPRWGQYVWPNYYISTDYDDEIAHMKEWLIGRLKWLDNKMGYVAPVVYGDVNSDDYVDITDITVLIDVLMSGEYDDDMLARSDLDSDEELTIGDLSALIDYILNMDSEEVAP